MTPGVHKEQLEPLALVATRLTSNTSPCCHDTYTHGHCIKAMPGLLICCLRAARTGWVQAAYFTAWNGPIAYDWQPGEDCQLGGTNLCGALKTMWWPRTCRDEYVIEWRVKDDDYTKVLFQVWTYAHYQGRGTPHPPVIEVGRTWYESPLVLTDLSGETWTLDNCPVPTDRTDIPKEHDPDVMLFAMIEFACIGLDGVWHPYYNVLFGSGGQDPDWHTARGWGNDVCGAIYYCAGEANRQYHLRWNLLPDMETIELELYRTITTPGSGLVGEESIHIWEIDYADGTWVDTIGDYIAEFRLPDQDVSGAPGWVFPPGVNCTTSIARRWVVFRVPGCPNPPNPCIPSQCWPICLVKVCDGVTYVRDIYFSVSGCACLNTDSELASFGGANIQFRFGSPEVAPRPCAYVEVQYYCNYAGSLIRIITIHGRIAGSITYSGVVPATCSGGEWTDSFILNPAAFQDPNCTSSVTVDVTSGGSWRVP